MWRLGVVSFLNARPLVAGLDAAADVQCLLDVPAALPGRLDRGEVDAALVPIIDVLRSGGRYRVLSDACLASDGETLTVRVFAHAPPQRIRTLWADPDSHTSVALARVIWHDLYGSSPGVRPLEPGGPTREPDVPSSADHDAVLLIGDKVVPRLGRYSYEVDLGAAWRELTGLPFVFAVWAYAASADELGSPLPPDRRESALSKLAARLSAARDEGVAKARKIAAACGPALGWPVALAERYLTQCLRFELDPPARRGAEEFARRCAALGLAPPNATVVWPGPPAPRRRASRPLPATGKTPPAPTGSPVSGGADAMTAAPPAPPTPWTRLSDDAALELYSHASIHELGRMAFARLMQLHPEPYRTYVVDRNINYANVCTARCIFCNFYRKPGHPEAYILTYEQIGRKIEELLDIGGTQVLMQGGLAPDEHHPSGHGLPFSWYVELLRYVKRHYPTIHIHAFSPPEIWAFHQIHRMPLREVLLRLRDAGLDTIPGGGGEILVDRVRRKIGRGKTLTDEWLAVMRAAHQLGMRTSGTMMFGHIETVPERIEHLRRLRQLQDETGGFTAFILWPFQPQGTPLGRWRAPPEEAGLPEEAGATAPPEAAAAPPPDPTGATAGVQPGRPVSAPRRLPDGRHLFLADAHEYLVMLALARLYLDNIPNIQSSWVTMGPKIGQLSLFFGANDMGSVMMEENVVSAAGTTFRLSEEEIRRLIEDAGWVPRQRDQYYRLIDPPRRRRPLPVTAG